MKFMDMPYERVNYEEVEKQMLLLMEEFKATESGEQQFAVHKKYYEFSDKIMTNITIAQIRHDIDTTDEFYSKEQDYYDEINPKISNLQVAYQKLLYHSPYRAYLEEKIGAVAFKNMEIAMKATDEKIIPLMQEENALTSEYDKLIASAKIDWEGETLNLSLIQKYMQSKDREVRRKAWEKYAG